MWTSRRVTRGRPRSGPPPRPRGRRATARAPRRAARGSGRVLARVAVALVARVEREPDDADRVRLAHPEQRRRHRQVLVDARQLHRLGEHVRRRVGLRRLVRRLAVGDPVRAFRRASSRSCSSSKPGGLRRAERDQQRARLPAVRVVRGVQRPARAGRGGRSRAGRPRSRPTCRRRRPRGRRSAPRGRPCRRCRRGR